MFKQVVKNWNAFPPNLWWFVCLENIVNTTVSVPITDINHRLHVWRLCDVYSLQSHLGVLSEAKLLRVLKATEYLEVSAS